MAMPTEFPADLWAELINTALSKHNTASDVLDKVVVLDYIKPVPLTTIVTQLVLPVCPKRHHIPSTGRNVPNRPKFTRMDWGALPA